ncbi:NAD-P-binding protein, partial [Athelia psychrophila]
LIYLYIVRNDRAILHVPPELDALGISRYTPAIAREALSALLEEEKRGEAEKGDIKVSSGMPGRTGRRYIVVGGTGFLGGWIVLQLLERGEDPKNIRIIDSHAPSRADLTTGPAKDVQLIQVDITGSAALTDAFLAPWPSSSSPTPGLTVFHTAANIRFYERHPALLPRSLDVNARGTQNVVDAARKAGATVLVYTSSASIQVKSTRFLLWPWEKAPDKYVQVFRDGQEESEDMGVIKGEVKKREDYFSNYAISKVQGEGIVRRANGTSSGAGEIRTGCIRPANGVFGPGGDILAGGYLVRQTTPTWVSAIVHNFIYVKNAAHGHLCYEARLLSPAQSSPDLSGQAFTITDPNPPPSYGDVYTVLSSLSPTTFPTISPTLMLLVSHAIEHVYLARQLLLLSPVRLLRALGQLVPAVTGDIVNLQPSLFNLTQVHLVWDDSRARELLGYTPRYTTLRGLCETVRAHQLGADRDDRRSKLGGGISLGWGLFGAERAVEDV